MCSRPEPHRRNVRSCLRATATLLAGAAAAALLGSCASSSDGGNPASPGGVQVALSSPSVQLTRTVTATASHTYAKAAPDCDWYVDGVLSGNPQIGTITQDNPATYSAPSAVPAAGHVVITAVSRADSTRAASDTLGVVFTVRYVDGATGNDDPSAGTWTNPYETVNYALSRAVRGDTVHVRPGLYDPAHGESGMFEVPPDVVLRGSGSDSTLLVASSPSAFVTLGDGAALIDARIRNEGAAPSFGIYPAGDSLLIRNVRIDGPCNNSGIRVEGAGSDALIEGCEIVGDGVSQGRGLELITGTHCTLRNCTISDWDVGLFTNNESDPRIEGCTFAENGNGILIFAVPGHPANPDLGGGARGSLGGNTFTDNSWVGLEHQSDNTIWALYNTWTTDPPTFGPPYPCDIVVTGSGSVICAR